MLFRSQELELDIGNLNFDSLENQEKFPRKRLSYNEKLSKQLHIFFMNSKIINALAKKFNIDLRFESVDIWIDGKGYKLTPHVDDPRIKLHLQVYLSNDNKGTTLYDKTGKELYTFPFKTNFGYALLNNEHSYHGVEEILKDGRTSLYVRFS